jgi:hypothetical protein
MFVDSLQEVTPSLLKQAYVEALYHTIRDEGQDEEEEEDAGFQWERLGSRFWLETLYKVSHERSPDSFVRKCPPAQ